MFCGDAGSKLAELLRAVQSHRSPALLTQPQHGQHCAFVLVVEHGDLVSVIANARVLHRLRHSRYALAVFGHQLRTHTARAAVLRGEQFAATAVQRFIAEHNIHALFGGHAGNRLAKLRGAVDNDSPAVLKPRRAQGAGNRFAVTLGLVGDLQPITVVAHSTIAHLVDGSDALGTDVVRAAPLRELKNVSHCVSPLFNV